MTNISKFLKERCLASAEGQASLLAESLDVSGCEQPGDERVAAVLQVPDYY